MIRQRNVGRLLAATSGLTLALALMQPAAAGDVSWAGGAPTGAKSWDNASYWVGGVLPTGNDDVMLNEANGNSTYIRSGIKTVNSLNIGSTEFTAGQWDGTLEVQGNGAGLNVNGDVLVGHGGDGRILVDQNAQMTVGGNLSLGQGTSGDGNFAQLTVSNQGVVTVDGSTVIGSDKNGILLINTGGTLQSNGYATLGELAGSEGTATVTGAGSNWTVGGNLAVGEYGKGSLAISDKGSVNAGGWVSVGWHAGGTGELAIENGGTLTSVGGYIGSEGAGKATVDGAGSSWTVDGKLSVGVAGTGTLTVENSGLVQAGSVVVGDGAGSGTVTLWTNGVLATGSVQKGAGAGIFNLNGGILRATGDSTNFISGFTGNEFYIGGDNGTIDTQAYDVTASSQIVGAGALIKTGSGTLTLTGTNSYAGETRINAGTVSVSRDENLGGGGIVLNGGTLQNTAAFTSARDVRVDANNGRFQTDAGLTLTGTISGVGGIYKTGAGKLTLTGTNSYGSTPGRGTDIQEGTVSVSRDENLGAATGVVVLNGGTLENTAAFSSARGVIITGRNGTLDTDANLTLTGVVSGAGTLTKTGNGTLTLTGENTYAGGTNIKVGTVSVSSDANLGDAKGGVILDNGWLQNTAAFSSARNIQISADNGGIRTDADLTLTGVVSGEGYLVKDGIATLTLTGANAYAGGTKVRGGTLQLGDGGTSGSVAGDVVLENSSTKLAFNRSDVVTFGNVISGSGGVDQVGSGTTVITGANTYTGATNVKAGTLAAGADNVFSTGSAFTVDANGTLDLAGYDQTLASLANAGAVRFGETAGTTLTINDDYVGNGGTIYLNTALTDDASATDRLLINGSTSGTGTLAVTNRGGLGGLTKEGIKIVDVGGASEGQFGLQGDFAYQGKQAVVGGAYAYQLYQGSITDPTDGDWYLRTASTADGKPLYNPGVPVYESLGGVAQELNGVGTLRQRVGNRYWGGAANPVIAQGDGPGKAEDAPEAAAATETATTVWGRIEGSHGRFEPETTSGSSTYDVDTYKMQAGVDGKLYETEAGSLIGGVTVHYGNAKADIESASGNGSVDIDGYGVGGTLTWYGDNGLYVDGVAQATWYKSDLGSDTLGTALVEDNDGFGYALSVETGKRIAIDQNWTITPQAQLSWSSVDFDSFTDQFGVGVSQDADESLKGRLGIAAEYGNGWMGADGKKVQTSVYAIANLYHEFMDGSVVDVAGVSFASQNDRTWGGIGTGGTYSWADGKYALYGEVSVDTSLENFADSYKLNGNLGLKVKW
ncbi:autotransporter [Brucella endophytica]|uniref:Autotransporter n=1 Tax=Brucella endophytica TaxID=1963359 RepID=A0A916SA36_9HYPH|nr:autotransporter outer membrane beta-barrel domain-containing protein [Brucella endophytica]GGA91021.1 autotransporter [Brucella endophytica]